MLKKLFKLLVIAGLFAALIPASWALADDREAQISASQQEMAQIASVAADTDAFIAELVDQWESAANGSAGWEAEFTTALQNATPEQLLAIKAANSYDAVRAILQGATVPVSVDGIGIEDLGDLSTDLVFTPLNPPCRILDTRFDADGSTMPTGGSIKSFYVHGTGTFIGAQGGNGAGCTAPKGEPVGAAINLAAVTPTSASHLRIWPYSYAIPTVSYLNYSTGQNLANAGIVSTCYNCGYDVSIYNGSTTHYLADVMGYFYPAYIGKAVSHYVDGYDWGAYCASGNCAPITSAGGFLTGAYSQTFTFDGTEEVLFSYNARAYGASAGTLTGSIWPAFHNVSVAYPGGITIYNSTYLCNTDFMFPSNGTINDQREIATTCKLTNIPAGTYQFGIWAQAGSDYSGAGVSYYLWSPKISLVVVRRP